MGSVKPLEHLGRSAREVQDALADGVLDLEEGERRFLAASIPRRRSRASRVARYGLVAMVAAVPAVGVVLWPRPEPLHFTVGAAAQRGEASAWLAAPSTGPLPLEFSDGTQWTLTPNARGRVSEVREHGATLVLESGSSSVDVRHRPKADWKVELGPFRVKVTGTRFDLKWDQETEEIYLALHAGRVVVSGCVFGEGHAIHAGEIVRASCREDRMEITKKGAEPLGSDSPSRQAAETAAMVRESDGDPALPMAEPTPAESGGMVPTMANSDAATQNRVERPARTDETATTAKDDWRELARQGRHAEAVAAAEAAGFSTERETATPQELMALGDAARFVGRLGRATEAYTTLRKRFPGDARAAVAAFSLGRVAFDQRGDFADAARWFRLYLAEMPAGRLARDARGRLMESLSRAGNSVGARKEAERYLEQYPSGPHADMARQLQSR
jgi:TolA-binding protein